MVSFLLIFYYKLYITKIAQAVPIRNPATTCDSVCCRSIVQALPTAPAIISTRQSHHSGLKLKATE